jgi:hypothetical protein
MLRFHTISLIIAAFTLTTLVPYNMAVAASPKDKDTNKYAGLIEQLVSPNKEPSIKWNFDEPSVKFPPGYDVKAQERIKAARQVLQDSFEAALPYLVRALDDKRYSMTIDWAEGDGYYNESVGSICRDVIASQLEVYADKIDFQDVAHSRFYDYPVSKNWYEKRKGQSLVQLQMEAVDWAIDRHKAEPKKRWDGVRRSRSNEISELKRLREKIAKSRKPVKPGRMYRMVTSDR